MNSLRASSRRASRSRISSSVAASWPTSSSESTGIGVEKSPCATFSAAASSRRRRPEWARAARKPATIAAASAISAGDQDLARDQADVVVDVVESGCGDDRDPADLVVERDRRRGLAEPLAADALDRGRVVAALERGGRGRVARLERRPLDLGVGDDERRLGPRIALAHAQHGEPRAARALGEPQDDLLELLLREALADHVGERRRRLVGRVAQSAEPLGAEARGELRHDVEVDEADRGRRDDREQDDELAADRAEDRRHGRL